MRDSPLDKFKMAYEDVPPHRIKKMRTKKSLTTNSSKSIMEDTIKLIAKVDNKMPKSNKQIVLTFSVAFRSPIVIKVKKG